MEMKVFIKYINVLCKPVGIDEIVDDSCTFNTECAREKWLHGMQAGLVDCEEGTDLSSIDVDSIDFTHFAYSGRQPYIGSLSDILFFDKRVRWKQRDKMLREALGKEDLGAKKNSKMWKARLDVAMETLTEDSEVSFFSCYEEWFPDFVDGIRYGDGMDVVIDQDKLEELKKCDMQTFMGYSFVYAVCDCPEDCLDAAGDIDLEKFMEINIEDHKGFRYIDEWENVGFATATLDSGE